MTRRVVSLRHLVGVALLAAAWLAAGTAGASVADLVAAGPAQDAAAFNQTHADLIQLGPGAVRELCGMLVPAGTGDDTNVRYLLSGLAKYVTQGRPEAERRMVGETLVVAMQAATDVEVRTFLLNQLQLAGGDEAVGPIAALLPQADLCEPATQALLAIATPAAGDALLAAFPAAQGPARLTIAKALGELRRAEAAPALIEMTSDENASARLIALYALANIGDPAAADALAQAAGGDSAYARAKVASYRLLYAQRLAERGERAAFEAACAELLGEGNEAHVRSAALGLLVEVKGRRALPQALAAAADADHEVRGAALLLAPAFPGRAATLRWAALLKDAPAANRVELLYMLGLRKDRAALPAVLDTFGDDDPAVRNAAVNAAVRIDGARATPRLVALLDTDDAERIAVVKAALLRVPARPALQAMARALPAMPAPGQTALLEALGARRAESQTDAVLALVNAEDESVRNAARQALANVASEERLLALVRAAADDPRGEAALEACLIKAGSGDVSADDKVAMYRRALEAAVRPEEKRATLAALAEIKTAAALELAAATLDDEAVRADAASAAARIALPPGATVESPAGAAARNVLERAAPHIADESLRARAEDYARTLAALDAEGFTPLFNGQDLTGWTGDVEGYGIEDGMMVCKPGGNLFTEKEFADFVFRFEFKLTPGANNGVGIRVPMGGHAAYDGMEIQILDDTAEKYKELQPYQFHGSIYGIAPAETGHLKPVGEWNHQDIVVQGRRVRIILNGVTIVDADLDEAMKDGAMDGKEHPGAMRASGHISFCGHGDVLWFRNIQVKEL